MLFEGETDAEYRDLSWIVVSCGVSLFGYEVGAETVAAGFVAELEWFVVEDTSGAPMRDPQELAIGADLVDSWSGEDKFELCEDLHFTERGEEKAACAGGAKMHLHIRR